jgi:hypothetical protein
MVVLDREGQERVPLRHSLGENRLRSTTRAHLEHIPMAA